MLPLVAALATATPSEPADVSALSTRVMAHHNGHSDDPGLVAALDAHVSAHPEDPVGHMWRALFSARAEEWNTALTHSRLACERAPSWATARRVRVVALAGAGRWDDVVSDVALLPVEERRRWMGPALAEAGRWSEAEAAVRTLLQQDDLLPAIAHQLTRWHAAMHVHQGNVDAAKAIWKSTDAAGSGEEAGFWYQHHHWKLAVAVWTAMGASGDMAAFNNAAWVLATAPDESARDGERAVRLVRRALATNADAVNWRHTLGAALAAAGDFDQAIAELQALYDRGKYRGSIDSVFPEIRDYQARQLRTNTPKHGAHWDFSELLQVIHPPCDSSWAIQGQPCS
ncbi:MAG: hypothetical protein KTR31_34135 [Myxococcales bacterium]|nr:hypothetical protein [Myxococcales bacterium]